jgi:ABC-type spermidine/putrescine transport system permease subunit I
MKTPRKISPSTGRRLLPGSLAAVAWPPLLFLVVMFVVPMAMILVTSLLARGFPSGVLAALSLDGWRQATDAYTLRIISGTILLATLVTAATALAGFLAAHSLWVVTPRFRHAVTAILVFPLVTSLLLRIYGWMNLVPFQHRGTWYSVAGVMAVTYLPFMILPILRSLERIDATLLHAAADLGATRFQVLMYVIIPLAAPGIAAGCVLVFVPACGDYLVPHFIGNGKITVLGPSTARPSR